METDLVIISNAIFDGRKDTTFPGAVTVAGNRITYVGDTECALDLCNSNTRVIDLGDRMLVSGFHDSHLHFFHSAIYRSPYSVYCKGPSEQACVDALRQVENARSKDDWMICYGWRWATWDDPHEPSKASLDAVYPDRPVCLPSGDQHTLWVNSCGLRKLGIAKDSVPPEGGRFGKDADGELTGIIYEAAALSQAPRFMRFSTEEIHRAYGDFMRDLNSFGITSVCDMSMTPVEGGDFILDDGFSSLESSDELTVRVHMYPTLTHDLSRPLDMQRRYRGEKLRCPGVKQFFDGVFTSHTAYLKQPYANAFFEGDRGHTTIPIDEMRDLVMGAAEKGIASRIHTIGDGAISCALDIFEEAQRRFGSPSGGLNCLEHLEEFDAEDIDRLSDLGVCAACQPPHVVLYHDGEKENLGPRRNRDMWPFQSILDKGGTLAFGTDSPCVDIDSMKVIYDAVCRRDPVDGYPESGFLPEQRISVADALRCYTYGSALAVGRGDEMGTIEVGKLADFAVIDRDLLAIPSKEILDAKVDLCIFDGKVVFARN